MNILLKTVKHYVGEGYINGSRLPVRNKKMEMCAMKTNIICGTLNTNGSGKPVRNKITNTYVHC